MAACLRGPICQTESLQSHWPHAERNVVYRRRHHDCAAARAFGLCFMGKEARSGAASRRTGGCPTGSRKARGDRERSEGKAWSKRSENRRTAKRKGSRRAIPQQPGGGNAGEAGIEEHQNRRLKSYMSWVKYVVRQYGFYLLGEIRIK